MRPRANASYAVLAAALLTPSAHADFFSWEIAGVVSESENEPLVDAERDSLAATYYFGSVDDSRGPYALASFLDPKSRVSLAVGREKQSLRPVTATSYGPPVNFFPPPPGAVVALSPMFLGELFGTNEEYSLQGRYVLPSKWYAGGGYSDIANADGSAASSGRNFDGEAYELFFGKYLGEATAIELAAQTSRRRDEQRLSFCVVAAGCVDTDPLIARSEVDTARLTARHVLRGRTLTYSFSGAVARTSGEAVLRIPEINVATLPQPSLPLGPFVGVAPQTLAAQTLDNDLGEFDVYSVGAELFPTAKLGVRIGYSRWDGESTADDAYDLGVTWFFARKVGLQLSYAKQSERPPLPFRNETATLRIVGRL